ncbi:helix-turn-helix domain-containing protein [Cupriavidus necator]|uniref:helix-turn-helix domain-containing protein n=1 Tax=Cupriavidus necator TaxID=106590 RepID=UPI000B274CDE|nr:helix-turn-helix domain-containing protein [Cupriavidus necator]
MVAKVHLRFLDYRQWTVLPNGRRTLHRRLSAEDTNFLSLLQSVRAELASRQILESDRSLADLLGFSSPSAFAFWFRKHFGMTVSGWRQASQVAETVEPRLIH